MIIVIVTRDANDHMILIAMHLSRSYCSADTGANRGYWGKPRILGQTADTGTNREYWDRLPGYKHNLINVNFKLCMCPTIYSQRPKVTTHHPEPALYILSRVPGIQRILTQVNFIPDEINLTTQS